MSVTTTKSASSHQQNRPEAEDTSTGTLTFPLEGALIPTPQGSLWDIYNPQPTRISRPSDEQEREEWARFCDKVDSILDQINWCRRLVLCLTVLSVALAAVISVGIFTFANVQSSDSFILLAGFILVGYSLFPICLVLTMKLLIPLCLTRMDEQMTTLFLREQAKRTKCERIRLSESEDKGHHVEIVFLEAYP